MFWYSIGFDSGSFFSYPGFDWSRNAIIFGVDDSSSVHTVKKEKDILALGEGPTQWLDDTTITAEVKFY